MDTEQIKMVLETIERLGGSASQFGAVWLAVHYAVHTVLTGGLIVAVVFVCRLVTNAVVASSTNENALVAIKEIRRIAGMTYESYPNQFDYVATVEAVRSRFAK